MPARIDVGFTLDGESRLISFADVHRLVCYLAEDGGAEAHHRQTKDFAAWPLLEDPRGFTLRINSLNDDHDLASRVRARLAGTPHLGSDLPLRSPRVESTAATYATLASAGAARSVTVEFVSPATFSRNGRSYGLPDPVLIHQQLARRWNELAPRASQVEEQLVKDLCSKVVVDDADVEVRTIHGVTGRIGFTGRARFAVTAGGRAERTLLRTLWAFAEYSGVGAMTAHGLGAVGIAAIDG